MSIKKVLIIQSKLINTTEIMVYLESSEYAVSTIKLDYKDIKDCLKKNLIDLILIDITHNDMDIIRKIKEIKKIPFLFISTSPPLDIIEKAAEFGADGFLLKPIKKEELKINIQLALRNNIATTIKTIYYLTAMCYFDLENELLYEFNSIIRISKNEKKFLKILISGKGSYISFTEIENQIWFEKQLSDSILRTLIYRLKKKLYNSSFIEVSARIGCRLNR